jgi:probable rRNA maturation factor
MKLIVEINNQSGEKIKSNYFSNVVRKTLELSGLNFSGKKEISVSIAMVDKKEIRRLNRIYRKKNAVTDILSFAEYKNAAILGEDKRPNIFLGELIVCYNDIKEYAVKKGTKTEHEMANVLSHGILHLASFRHGKKMFGIQEKIVKQM